MFNIRVFTKSFTTKKHGNITELNIKVASPNMVYDGTHNLSELYKHRNLLFIHLCNAYPDKATYKKVNDTDYLLFLELQTGQVSYSINYTDIIFLDKKISRDDNYVYDGHTSVDVMSRLIHDIGGRI